MPKVRTQADRRQHATVTDPAGRKFAVIIEKDTMHPCSSPVPKGWSPPKLYGRIPFLIPEKYMGYKVDDPFSMTTDYEGWLADVEAEHRSYEDRLSSSAMMMLGSGAAAAVRDRSPELMRYVGDPPMPVEPIKAAMKGNLFVLGLSDRMPTWAEPFFVARVEEVELFPNAEDFPDAAEDFEPAVADSSEFPDVEEPADRLSLILDPELEDALDLEEHHDPRATGGTKTDPRAQKSRAPIEKPTPAKAKARR